MVSLWGQCSHLLLRNSKLAQQLLSVLQGQSPEVSVGSRHRLLGRLGLLVVLEINNKNNNKPITLSPLF